MYRQNFALAQKINDYLFLIAVFKFKFSNKMLGYYKTELLIN